MQGLPGLNYLMPEVDGKNPWDPRIPESSNVISFKKAKTLGSTHPCRRRVSSEGFLQRRGSAHSPDAIPASDGYISFPVSQVGLLSWALLASCGACVVQ
ncbi:hypothetical protein HPP92_009877 [Vanilla planifolia]|uniref:Uncharacterized protein n=1 Tax=Vanilla planifolia TaxID=51239 RepID=A0A835V1Y3_VANPL|nr:hypothetical protein HPP92_009877 [Vanilla planifolia]